MNTKFVSFGFFPALIGLFLFLFTEKGSSQTVSFTSSALAGETIYNPTSLQFGPDGRLYVSQQNGLIHAYTISRSGANNYSVTNTEVITAIQQIPNHNDDGALNATVNTRQVTGLLVTGTAANPVLYVSSSDPRIGGGTNGPGNDKFLDTNSGVISKLTKNGSSWQRLDLVRGLPRSEENHSTNGMQLDKVNNILYVCQGGNTNMGAPSNNLVYTPEYALSSAILKINLNAIGNTTYDLPTLDDEDKTNSSSVPGYVDNTDPFGGNNGKNQAIIDPSGPVQVYSPGWRNNYDLVITQAGKMYSFDNGPNANWGGEPVACSNATSEPGVMYCDYMHYIPSQGYYAGHPNPTRGNRNNKFNASNPQSPVPVGSENPVECSYIIPANHPDAVTGICASTNGMAEYTASNFSNAMKGNLLAASFNGKIYRFKMTAAGDTMVPGGQTVLASGFGTTPLDVTAQGDVDIFPGTIWAVTYGSHGITVFEPGDYGTATLTQYFADDDEDTYGNVLDTVWAASQPAGYVANDDDCDDSNPNIYPGATEIADGKDNDCDGFVDEYLGVATTVRINCGGSQYIAADGDTFSADIYYTSGTAGVSSTNPSISNSNDDLLYKSERYGNFSYNVGIPNGSYTVSLYFAEIWSGGQAVGSRVFHVDLEGTRVLNNYDIYADAGGYAAAVKTFNASVSDGQLNLVFTKVINNSKINAIEIVKVQNTAPTFTTSGNITVNEDFASAQHVTVTPDPVPPSESGQTVTYSLSPASVSFANVSINSSTGKVTVNSVQNGNGSQVFTITANDGQPVNNTASKTFTLTVSPVNDAPAFNLSGNITEQEGFSGTKTVSVSPATVPADEQSQSVTYSLQPSSVSFANVSINTSTGTVSITKVANGNGSQVFTVIANDGQSANNTYSQPFTLTITAVNDAPSFALSGNISEQEDFSGNKTVSVSPATVPADEQSQSVSYSLSPASVSFANVSINASTGTVSITKVANGNGSQEFTVTANDGQSSNNTYSQTFTLAVSPVNDAPAFSLSGNITEDEDFSGTKTVTAAPSPVPSDEASQSITYSLQPSSVSFANVSINSSNGTVSVTKVANGIGSQVFTVIANDGQSSNNTYSQTFTLTINALNDAPAFTLSGSINAGEDFSGTRTVYATAASVPADEQSQAVTYSLQPSSVSFANVSINASTGNVSISKIDNANGSQVFTVVANDGQSSNNTYSQTFTLNVSAVNDPPVFTLSGNITADEDFSGAQTVSASISPVPSDETAQPVRFSISPASVGFANVSIDSLTGLVTITSKPNAFGSQQFTVTANDNQSQNNLHSATFQLQVNPVNDAPAFTVSGDVVENEDFAGSRTVTVAPNAVPSNEAGQTVTYSLAPASVSFANVSFNASTGQTTFTSITGKSGSQTFTVAANDGQAMNNTYSQTFSLTVGSINDAPTLDPLADVLLNEDASAQVIALTGIGDGDNGSQTITVSALSSNTALVPQPVVSYAGGSTGSLTLQINPNMDGIAIISVTVNDGGAVNNTITRNMIVTVNAVNDAPYFSPVSDLAVPEDAGMQQITLTGIMAGPNEAQMLVFTATSSNTALIPNPVVSYLNPDATAALSLIPADNKNGSATITLTVNDGAAVNNLFTRNFTVTVNAVNDAPTLNALNDLMINEDAGMQTIALSGITSGPNESQTLTITASSDNLSLIPNPTVNYSNPSGSGSISFAPAADKSGIATITVVVNDGQSDNNTITRYMLVSVSAVNDAPLFSLSGNIEEERNFSGTRFVTAAPGYVPADEAGQIVSYSLQPASVSFANVTIDPATGTVSVAAIADSFGSMLFAVIANDGQSGNNLASAGFNLLIGEGNYAPTFSLSGSVTEAEDFAGTRRVAVIPDPVHPNETGQTVTYALSPSSVDFAGINFNSATGEISISSVEDASGSQLFTITADDGQPSNNLASETFVLTVISVNDAPSFTLSGDVIETEDYSGTRAVQVFPSVAPSDEQLQTITYSLNPASVDFAEIEFDSSTGAVTIRSLSDGNGMELFTITADDGQGENHLATGSFMLVVNAVNDAPSFTLSGDLLLDEDFSVPAIVTISGSNVPADEMSQQVIYSLNPPSVSFANISIDSLTGRVEVLSVKDSSGSEIFTVTADDGQSQHSIATGSFILAVNAVNDQPVFALSGDVSADENFTDTLRVIASPVSPDDESGQSVTYSLSPASVAFANVLINQATGVVEITSVPNGFGTQVFTVIADDGQAENHVYSAAFTLTVSETNLSPVFAVSGNISVDEDFSNTETLIVNPNPAYVEAGETVSYTLHPSNVSFASVSFHSATGEVSFTSMPDASGQQLFTITADDGKAFSNLHSETFMLTVNAVNDAPVMDAIASQVIQEDALTQYISLGGIAAGAEENQSLAISASSSNPAIIPHPLIQYNSPDDFGMLSYAPNADMHGTAIITVRLTDGQQANNEFTISFTVEVVPVNDYPTLNALPDVVIDEDAPLQMIQLTGISAGANEAEPLNISAGCDNPLLLASVAVSYTNGQPYAMLSFEPVANKSGYAEISILVDDGQAEHHLASQAFTVQVNPVNDPPMFSAPADLALNEDFGMAHAAITPISVAADEQQQSVRYSLQPASVPFLSVAFDSLTGSLHLNSINNASGEQLFAIIANDGQSENSIYIDSFKVTVIPVNDPPLFHASSDVVLSEDFSLTAKVNIVKEAVPADEAGEIISYSLSPASVDFANISFNPATGKVNITAIPDGNGTQIFTITADDGQGVNNTATGTFMLKILPVNDAPAFSVSNDLYMTEDFSDTAAVSVTPGNIPADEAAQVATYSLSPASVSFANIEFDAQTGHFTATSIPDANGVQVFTITADDGQPVNNTVLKSFTLSVQPVNDAPLFSVSGDVAVAEDFASSQTVDMIPASVPLDEINQNVIYTLTPRYVGFAAIDFDSITGLVTVSSIQDANGSQLFTVTADDGQSSDNTASRSFMLAVEPVNDAPLFHMSQDIHLNEDFPITAMVDAIANPVPADEISQGVVYSLNPPSVDFANIMFDSATGHVMISAVPDGNGDQLFTVTANDGQSLNNIATGAFMLMIHPRNDAPLFTLSGDVTEDQDFTGTRSVTVTALPVPLDELPQIVQYSLNPSSVSFAQVAINAASGEVTIQPVQGRHGIQIFTVTANDGEVNNNTASASFTLTINAATELPAISLSGDVAVSEDFTTTEVVTVLANATSPNSYPVEARSNVFIPQDVYVFQGDIVEWTNYDGWHNVNADTAIFTDNPEGFGNAVDAPGWVFSHQFNIPGKYDYQCDPHALMGMIGSVTVLPNRPPIKHHVSVFNMAFSPRNLVILQGDTVEWTNTEGWHNVNFDTLAYPNNPVGFGNDVAGPGWKFSWVFDASGFYNYQCDPHVYMDMVGTVRVVERSGTLVGDTSLPVVYRLYPAASDLADVRIDSSTGTVLITSVPNRNGVQDFEVIADYGIGTKSDVFKLKVNPVDDQPGDFALLYPYNNSVEILDDKLQLKWNASPEVDGDNVSYALSINGLYDHITIMNITDTVMDIDASRYLKNDTLYEWWVTATDGISDMECSEHFFFKRTQATGWMSVDAADPISVIDFPNPFHTEVNLQYRLPGNWHVKITIYSLLGERVTVIADEDQLQGAHQIQWDGTDQKGTTIAPGMYFYHFEAADQEGKTYEKSGSLVNY